MLDFRNIIKESINKILKEALNGSVNDNSGNDVILNEYDAIGFANKFYTLWKVIEKKYTKTFVYRKNISFSKEKAFALYPNAKFDETLRGKTHSFTVSVASNGMADGDFFINHKENVNVVPGQPVDIEKFIVTNAGIKMSKYNKPYFCIVGHDLSQSENFDFILNCFNKPEIMPKKGDILKVNGEIGFFNEKAGDIYINNGKFEILDRSAEAGPESEEGRKFKNEPMVLSKMVSPVIRWDRVEKNGFIVLTDENGEDFYVDTVVSNFRNGSVQIKIDCQDFSVGDKFAVSGTVQVKNGFKKLLRVKLVLIEAVDKEERDKVKNGPKEVKVMTCQETISQGKNITSNKTYKFSLDEMDSFFNYIISYKEKYNARIEDGGMIVRNSKEELEKSFYKRLNDDVDYGGYQMWSVIIQIPQTKEKLVYNFKIYFRVNEDIYRNMKKNTIKLTEAQLKSIIKESVNKILSENCEGEAEIKGGLYNDKELNYTHFAVNKMTGLIVDGWDYSGYDSEDLKMDKKAFFTDDMINNGFNPKAYKILSFKGCQKQGIDPNNKQIWSNTGVFPLPQEVQMGHDGAYQKAYAEHPDWFVEN